MSDGRYPGVGVAPVPLPAVASPQDQGLAGHENPNRSSRRLWWSSLFGADTEAFQAFAHTSKHQPAQRNSALWPQQAASCAASTGMRNYQGFHSVAMVERQPEGVSASVVASHGACMVPLAAACH